MNGRVIYARPWLRVHAGEPAEDGWGSGSMLTVSGEMVSNHQDTTPHGCDRTRPMVPGQGSVPGSPRKSL
jgi:hypothetical protein